MPCTKMCKSENHRHILDILTSNRNASQKRCITCYMFIMQVRKCSLSWLLIVFHIMTYWKFGSVFKLFQTLGGSVIYKDAPCACGTGVFATECCKSLWKLFYKQENIKFFKRNNNWKRQEQIMIMMSGLFSCWNMDEMTFCVFMSHERRKPFFGGIFIFIMGVSPSNVVVVVSSLLTSSRKDYFLRQRLRRYRF